MHRRPPRWSSTWAAFAALSSAMACVACRTPSTAPEAGPKGVVDGGTDPFEHFSSLTQACGRQESLSWYAETYDALRPPSRWSDASAAARWCHDPGAAEGSVGVCETATAGVVWVARRVDATAGLGAEQAFVYEREPGSLRSVSMQLWGTHVCAGEPSLAAAIPCLPSQMLECLTGQLRPVRDMRNSGAMR